MQTATRYYREQLKKNQRAIDYLKRRGLSGEVAARFNIGYSPDDWQNLPAAAPNYQDASLVETGLVIAGEERQTLRPFPRPHHVPHRQRARAGHRLWRARAGQGRTQIQISTHRKRRCSKKATKCMACTRRKKPSAPINA